MFNQIFILDLKGKVLVARNYRGELDSGVIDKFMPLLMERGDKSLKGGGEPLLVSTPGFFFKIP